MRSSYLLAYSSYIFLWYSGISRPFFQQGCDNQRAVADECEFWKNDFRTKTSFFWHETYAAVYNWLQKNWVSMGSDSWPKRFRKKKNIFMCKNNLDSPFYLIPGRRKENYSAISFLSDHLLPRIQSNKRCSHPAVSWAELQHACLTFPIQMDSSIFISNMLLITSADLTD